MKPEDDLISSLTFLPLSELQKEKGDRMQNIRANFVKALIKQKESAQKFVENPDRKLPKDEKPIFTKVGDKYSIEPRYGRRKVVLVEGSAIVVDRIEDVVSTIEKIIASVNKKAPSIEAALIKALEPKKTETKEDKTNPAPASGSSTSGRTSKSPS